MPADTSNSHARGNKRARYDANEKHTGKKAAFKRRRYQCSYPVCDFASATQRGVHDHTLVKHRGYNMQTMHPGGLVYAGDRNSVLPPMPPQVFMQPSMPMTQVAFNNNAGFAPSLPQIVPSGVLHASEMTGNNQAQGFVRYLMDGGQAPMANYGGGNGTQFGQFDPRGAFHFPGNINYGPAGTTTNVMIPYGGQYAQNTAQQALMPPPPNQPVNMPAPLVYPSVAPEMGANYDHHDNIAPTGPQGFYQPMALTSAQAGHPVQQQQSLVDNTQQSIMALPPGLNSVSQYLPPLSMPMDHNENSNATDAEGYDQPMASASAQTGYPMQQQQADNTQQPVMALPPGRLFNPMCPPPAPMRMGHYKKPDAANGVNGEPVASTSAHTLDHENPVQQQSPVNNVFSWYPPPDSTD
ncbi:hypothetical protein CYLTODRAFT_454864 [Cylindrobasidium torrendii FP15055 ss-10]|uniref:Uncharacterized protein n=1 Tax=Cylindrobasidium torrendii FP15055 ss-10 TaxID=1314674 RepID=A0A0D7B9R3_9AGAR|nr:hypothetical protein CYLTODRAFT_454864 [Cylindrobasidium torrendii FP15055 ss-10]